MFSDRSVKTNSVLFFFPDNGLTLKLALGAEHATGVGTGDGVGVAVGELEPLLDALGDGDGDGDDPDGVGDGLGDDVVTAPRVGAMAIVADADADRVTSDPPRRIDISGINGEKWPWTSTVTVCGDAQVPAEQDGLQLNETSASVTVTQESLASLRVRHITRLVISSHGWPADHEVGETAASMAPSRAALVMVICEYQTRPRSTAPATSRMRKGRISASSTRAWPRERGRMRARRRKDLAPGTGAFLCAGIAP
jgi:hypothetical protein